MLNARSESYDRATAIVVDNSLGAEAAFASSVCAALEAAGFDVELRPPTPETAYDTSVRFMVEGLSVRVPEGLGTREIANVAAAVRDAEADRAGDRRRTRPVPIYRGETRRVLVWVDVFS